MAWRHRRRLFTDEQLIKIYEQGLNDTEIGERLGADRCTVRYHRRRIGLKAYGHKRLFTDEQLIELYEQGLNDREICEKLGVDRWKVTYRRRKLGFKSHKGSGKYFPRCSFTDEQLIELYEQGLSDREIAKKLGEYLVILSVCRRRLGLKAHSRKNLFTDYQLIELWEQGLTDRKIAEKFGADQSTVRYHRRRIGLKAIREHKR